MLAAAAAEAREVDDAADEQDGMFPPMADADGTSGATDIRRATAAHISSATTKQQTGTTTLHHYTTSLHHTVAPLYHVTILQ